jgi:hypothetical protein
MKRGDFISSMYVTESLTNKGSFTSGNLETTSVRSKSGVWLKYGGKICVINGQTLPPSYSLCYRNVKNDVKHYLVSLKHYMQTLSGAEGMGV